VARRLPEPESKPAIETLVDGGELQRLQAAHAEALGTARQTARLLCGITSPAATRAKLTREPLHGRLADRRFAEVLGWCHAFVTPA
jgi:ATP-dependent DNA helicase RecQ